MLEKRIYIRSSICKNINQYGFTSELKRFIYKNKLLYALMVIIGNNEDEKSFELAKNKLVKI